MVPVACMRRTILFFSILLYMLKSWLSAFLFLYPHSANVASVALPISHHSSSPVNVEAAVCWQGPVREGVLLWVQASCWLWPGSVLGLEDPGLARIRFSGILSVLPAHPICVDTYKV